MLDFLRKSDSEALVGLRGAQHDARLWRIVAKVPGGVAVFAQK